MTVAKAPEKREKKKKTPQKQTHCFKAMKKKPRPQTCQQKFRAKYLHIIQVRNTPNRDHTVRLWLGLKNKLALFKISHTLPLCILPPHTKQFFCCAFSFFLLFFVFFLGIFWPNAISMCEMKICRRTCNFYLNARLLPWQLTQKRERNKDLHYQKQSYTCYEVVVLSKNGSSTFC